MNENITCTIDSNKINSTMSELIPIYNLVNNTNILEEIQDIEKKITTINLEHGNCIKNYSENMNEIYTKINVIKRQINELFESLTFAIDTVNNHKISDIDGIKKMVGYYSDTNSGQEILNIFKQANNSLYSAMEMRKIQLAESVNNQFNNQEQPSTIPVGLGIAASGIAASAGTVIVDSMYSNEKENESEIENIDEYVTEEKINKSDNLEEKKYEMDDIPIPYHASRDKDIVNKFYDDNNE